VPVDQAAHSLAEVDVVDRGERRQPTTGFGQRAEAEAVELLIGAGPQARVAVHLGTGRYFSIDLVGTEIVDLIQTGNDVGTIVSCLVTRYGGVPEILAALDDPAAGFAPGLRGKLAAARDYLDKALPVCKVALDVKLPDFDPALPRAPKNPDALLALAERWNLAGSARRLVDALSGDPA